MNGIRNHDVPKTVFAPGRQDMLTCGCIAPNDRMMDGRSGIGGADENNFRYADQAVTGIELNTRDITIWIHRHRLNGDRNSNWEAITVSWICDFNC